MKRILSLCRPYIAEIWSDLMLSACIFAPILMGLVFRFLLPLLEGVLCAELGAAHFFAPYYRLFDLLLAVMTPMMSAFSGVMVMLGELDDGTARYISVTPAGRSGYLLSRLGVPAAAALVYDVILLLVFNLSSPTIPQIILYSVCGSLYGIITAMLVVSLAKNKVEGMALTKLSGLLLLGLPIAYLVERPLCYAACPLPSFWLAMFAIESGPAPFFAAVALSALWIFALSRRFFSRLL